MRSDNGNPTFLDSIFLIVLYFYLAWVINTLLRPLSNQSQNICDRFDAIQSCTQHSLAGRGGRFFISSRP